MKDNITYGVIGLLLGVLLTWLFTSSAVNNQNMGMMRMMGMGKSASTMSNIDEHFIDQMIPHHEDAIIMAELGLEKAEHQEIKQLSQDIIKSQSQEINQMKKWREEWYGSSNSFIRSAFAHGHGDDSMHTGMMGDATDIDKLESARPFDKVFIEEMIPHHQMAIMMAQMLLQSTTRPEMKTLAEDIITAQTREIEQMRSWYRAWYK